MKYVYMFILGFSVISFAKDCKTIKAEKSIKEQLEINTDIPNFLKGATIIVRLSNGKESSVPAEQFKVVPRKQQFIVTHDLEATHLLCESEEVLKNRVSLIGGVGRNAGLKSSTSGSKVTVEEEVGFVGGAQYQRKLGQFSVGIQAQTNQTGSLLFGIDF